MAIREFGGGDPVVAAALLDYFAEMFGGDAHFAGELCGGHGGDPSMDRFRYSPPLPPCSSELFRGFPSPGCIPVYLTIDTGKAHSIEAPPVVRCAGSAKAAHR